MAARNIDWNEWGPKAVALYESGLSFKRVTDELNLLGLAVKPSGVHAFLVRQGLIRGNAAAQRIARSLGRWNFPRDCEHCGIEFTATSKKEKWCVICVPDQESGHRIRRYGISKPECDALLASQGGKCALCPKSEKLVIDHDHRTGRARGFLCYQCNIAMGSFDKPGWIQSAKRYVLGLHDELPPGTFTPEFIGELDVLGDRAAELHTFNHGPGGDWNGIPDFYHCF